MRERLFIFIMALFSVSFCWAEGDTLGVHLPDADELHILSSEDEVPQDANDSYMRIALDRKVEAGKWTLIVFPTAMDGYYFGQDAERYRVKSYDLFTDPVTIDKEDMDDLEDFAANQTYLVKSKSDMDQLVAMSPGIKTEVPKTTGVTLICLTLDDIQFDGIEEIKATDLNDAKQVYDLSGRLAKTVGSGIIIVNGKKVFEK